MQEAVLLEAAQGLGQHLGADALQPTLQLTEPQWAVLQRADREGRPLVREPGGLVVAVPSGTSPELLTRAAESGVRVASYLVEPDGHALAEIAALIECGAVRAEVEEVFPLADAVAAHRRLEDGRTRGKLVLAVR